VSCWQTLTPLLLHRYLHEFHTNLFSHTAGPATKFHQNEQQNNI
jgi:hypothetical protein